MGMALLRFRRWSGARAVRAWRIGQPPRQPASPCAPERLPTRCRLRLQPLHGVYLRLHIVEIINDAPLFINTWDWHGYTSQICHIEFC
jgi:hypothetical protein